jgi:nucleoside-diphosphate-sugar epimerase
VREVVVTGAGSSLGAFAVGALAELPDTRVTGVYSPRSGAASLAHDLTAAPTAELRERLASAERVFHFAWSRGGEAEQDNRLMIDRLLGAIADPGRLVFISSASASATARSRYGWAKYAATRQVEAAGGTTLVCGLVVEPSPERGPYRLLRSIVAGAPLAFRAVGRQPMVYPVRLSDLAACLVAALDPGLPPATYRMFAPPLALNRFVALIETLHPRRRIPAPFVPGGGMRAAEAAGQLHLVSERLVDQVKTFLYKDDRYLLGLRSLPGVELPPCTDTNYLS